MKLIRYYENQEEPQDITFSSVGSWKDDDTGIIQYTLIFSEPFAIRDIVVTGVIYMIDNINGEVVERFTYSTPLRTVNSIRYAVHESIRKLVKDIVK